jgi:alanine racemase
LRPALIRALIDREALRANLRLLRARAGGARVMAVVKANAYGHGLVPTALALPEADAFGVARLEEGVALREAGVRQPIVLLEGVFSAEQLDEAAQQDFEIVVHATEQIELLERSRSAHRFILWLKIDTGMNRLGFRVAQFAAAHARVRALRAPPRELRLLTHLARADERDCEQTLEQLERFRAVAAPLGLATSIANSAGVLGWSAACAEWVRPGLALYGVSPFAGQDGAALGLRPAMRFETEVIAVREVPEGEPVGYGGAWRAPRHSRIAILAGGYGDGLPRALENGTPVLVEGQRTALAGRVSMDMIAVDITGCAGIHVCSRALLWGPQLPVEQIAVRAGTIPYELLCGVRQRVPRELV